MDTITNQGLWKAVESRDAHADGLFVYAVRSTGVYCRPSCASRRPRRDRVEFFPAPAMAEAGGYRACRRCHPERAAIESTPDVARVRRACEAIGRKPDAPWTSRAITKAGGASVAQLQRSFRRVLGLAPRDYVAACRHRRFLDTLRSGAAVTDAIYESGYGSPSRVYESMRLPGMTPATYGRGGTGAQIEWTSVASPIGRILVAATTRGLCAVRVAPTDRESVAALQAEFPRAVISRGSSNRLDEMAAAAKAVADGQAISGDVPVDIRGTAFQWRVWRALTRIPVGETRSYAAVARAIGQPTATRAVARACATNPIALVVPCHRVVREDGELGGYRWGTHAKRALLTTERAAK
jgi:AraC family transcriptional regulator of adaptative response/methylated-DNA-[protein]-cysteine methyltransferase